MADYGVRSYASTSPRIGQEWGRTVAAPALRNALSPEAGQARRAWLDDLDARAMNALHYYLGPHLAPPVENVLALGAVVSPGQDVAEATQAGRDLMDWNGPLDAAGDAATMTAAIGSMMLPGGVSSYKQGINALAGEMAGAYDPNTLNIFAGIGAKTADPEAMMRAQDMAQAGADRGEIWRETGWFQGADGRWRFEIDDSGAQYTPGNLPVSSYNDVKYRAGPLSDALEHPDLFSAYPDTAGIERVVYDFENSGKRGEYRDGEGAVLPETITSWASGDGTNVHEIQHAIQRREGFASGTNPSEAQSFAPLNPAYDKHMQNLSAVERARGYYNSPSYQRDRDAQNERFNSHWRPQLDALDSALERGMDADQWSAEYDRILDAARDETADLFPNLAYLDRVAREYGLETPSRRISGMQAYHRTAGEVEARNAARRLKFSPEERRATPPWVTQDVPDDEQILRRNGQPVNALRGN